jgi:hypothetical protein
VTPGREFEEFIAPAERNKSLISSLVLQFVVFGSSVMFMLHRIVFKERRFGAAFRRLRGCDS